MGLELRGEKEPIESVSKGKEGQGLDEEGSELAFHGFGFDGIVRRPRFTLSNEPGATTGSVFNSDEGTRFAPLAGFA